MSELDEFRAVENIRKRWESNYWDDRHRRCHVAIGALLARIRALEAALVALMVAPTNHENADTSREYNSAWEAARDTLGFNPFEHRRQAALTEPPPPQEEPR